MHSSKKKLQCDVRRLRSYLDQRLSATEEAELETHLDECPACRRQISDWAAEPRWWTSAGKYLRPDVWDQELDESPAITCG
jgi:anti-sigma factor RsiW